MNMTDREAEATNDPQGRVPEGRMRSVLLPILAFAALVAFLGVLVVWVPRVDLICVVAFTVLLAGYDFFVKREK